MLIAMKYSTEHTLRSSLHHKILFVICFDFTTKLFTANSATYQFKYSTANFVVWLVQCFAFTINAKMFCSQPCY